MGEIGIDIGSHYSKHVDEFAGQEFDYVLTVCDNANETCPCTRRGPGGSMRASDLVAAEGSEEERLEAFRVVDELMGYLGRFPGRPRGVDEL